MYTLKLLSFLSLTLQAGQISEAIKEATLLKCRSEKCTGGQHIQFYFNQVTILVQLLCKVHPQPPITDTLYRVPVTVQQVSVQIGPVPNFPQKTNSIPVKGKYMKLQQTDT